MNKEITMPEEETEVPNLPATVEPNAVVLMAMQKGYTPELIEKMMDLQERNDDKIAKQFFHKAMAEFKAILPPVFKDKNNKQYNSKYASESSLLNTLNPFLSKQGLSASFSFPETQGDILKVTCTITHKNGYGESVTLPGPLDTSGSKNPLQQVRSTVTYLRKATFEAITGIATSDPTSDDDGNAAGEIQYITDAMQKEINDLIKSTKADKAKVLKYLKAESVEKILLSDYGKAKVAFETKAKTEKKPMREVGEEG